VIVYSCRRRVGGLRHDSSPCMVKRPIRSSNLSRFAAVSLVLLASVAFASSSSAAEPKHIATSSASKVVPHFGAVPRQFSIQHVTVTGSTSAGVSGSATLHVVHSQLYLAVSFSYTDSSNWRLDAGGAGSHGSFSPAGVRSLQVDAASFTGYLARSSGNVSGTISAGSVTWKPNSSVTITGALVIGADCGLAESGRCPSAETASGPFLTFSGAKENGRGTVTGGFSTDGKWARIEATGIDSYSAGNSVSISSPTLTIWKGERTDSFNSNLVLPDLSADNGGVNAEFCGNFTMQVPMLNSNSSSAGCARLSKSGVVIGQVAASKSALGGANSDGTTGSAAANAGGVAWTNVPAKEEMPVVTMFGKDVSLVSGAVVFSGTATIPSSFAARLHMPSPSFDVVGTITSSSLTATGHTNGSFSYNAAPLSVSASNFDFELKIQAASGNAPRTWSLTGSKTASAGVGYAGSHATIPVSLVASGSNSTDLSIRATAGAVTISRNQAADGKAHAASGGGYIWTDAFGVHGFNLSALDASFSIDSSTRATTFSLSLGVALNPHSFPSILKGHSMINGQLNVSRSGEKRCLIFGFDGGESGGVSIAGGAMVARRFGVAVNSLSSTCAAELNGSSVSLEPHAKGLRFSSTIGDASFDMSLSKAPVGYHGSVSLANLKLGGVEYREVNLTVSSGHGSSSETFTAAMKTSFGFFRVSAGLVKDHGTTTQSLSASGDHLNVGSAKFRLNQVAFAGSFIVPASGCATSDFNANASGTAMGDHWNVHNISLSLRCSTITNFDFRVSLTHWVVGGDHSGPGASKTYSLGVNYEDRSNGHATFSLSAGLAYHLTFSRRGMDRNILFSGDIRLVLSTYNSWGSNTEAELSGSICASADRVSGCAMAAFATNGSFSFAVTLRVNPSFAGIWRFGWSV